jgi:hypothetical protein
MAKITKRKTGWFVQGRRTGYTPRCETSRTNREARRPRHAGKKRR